VIDSDGSPPLTFSPTAVELAPRWVRHASVPAFPELWFGRMARYPTSRRAKHGVEDQGAEVAAIVRDRRRRARSVPDRPVNAGYSRSLPDNPIHRLTCVQAG